MKKKTLKKAAVLSLAFVCVLLVTMFTITACDFGSGGTDDPIVDWHPETYLIYGYDVIRSGYINGAEVKRAPILSLSKLKAANVITQTAYPDGKFEIVEGESVKQVYQSVTSNISASVGFSVFSVKAESEFKKATLDTGRQLYVKVTARQIKKKEELNRTAVQLRDYLDQGFIAAINNASTGADYDQLFRDYGTHLIARCYWGGLADVNYSYSATESTTINAVKNGVGASWNGMGADFSVEQESTGFNIESTTQFKCHIAGGVDPGFTTVKQFFDGYSGWVASLNTPNADLRMCGIESFDTDLVPIWKLVEGNPSIANSTAKATAIESRFNTLGMAQGNVLENLPNVQRGIAGPYRPDGSNSFSYEHKQNPAGAYFPARFEVSLIGGGGGGQSSSAHITAGGSTGSGGGGGAAARLSFDTEEAITRITLTVGEGGDGGIRPGSSSNKGNPGGNGSLSSATWNGITITANGGKGGGQAGDVIGGAGGKATMFPEHSPSVKTPQFANGTSGSPGFTSSWLGGTGSKTSRGGPAGQIGDFGGQIGGINTGQINGTYGSGGAGAQEDLPHHDGGYGGDGLIQIIYDYFE